MIIESTVNAPRVLALQAQSGALSMEERSIIITSGLALDLANQLIDALPIEEKPDSAGAQGDTIASMSFYAFTFKEMQHLWQVLNAPGACEPQTLAKAKDILFAL